MEDDKRLDHLIPDGQVDKDKCFIDNVNKNQIITLIFKTANRIGSLGDNAEVIKKEIKSNQILSKIVSEGIYKTATIVAHTRWASVGKINIPNCHPIDNTGQDGSKDFPLVLSCMNGDIYNYKSIIQEKEKELNYKFNDDFSTDCQALPISLTNIDFKSEAFTHIINQNQGSYAIALQSSMHPGEIHLVKKGKQGLYVGISYDQIMFASDVYGLIESCRYFISIGTEQTLCLSDQISPLNNNFSLTINTTDNNDDIIINKKHLKTTNITTRDIDKKDYNHFLEKEIFETENIVLRTMLGYLQSDDLIKKKNFCNAIICDEGQVPKFIVDKLLNGTINKIVITGMGTCYTAAVAISGYMREMLELFFPDIIVEPHVASEGSAFYINSQMNDTLVIVIAQSGTTIDTNVYVQMAKERGASTLAIANKREGDVTYIVDGTLYIGSGRDIEIAVPSTKTYTAQVILGYILTLYFCTKANKNGNYNEALSDNISFLRNTPELIKETFSMLDDQKLSDLIKKYPIRVNDWYIGYDDSPNSVCAMEIRIKYSEGCYQSLPYLNINDLFELNISNSFIIYITNKESSSFANNLTKLLNNNNRLIVITSGEIIRNNFPGFSKNSSLSFISIPNASSFYSFIPTTLTGQLLSYYTAVELDKRKIHFQHLIDSIDNKYNLTKMWGEFVSLVKQGEFNQGFSIIQFNRLNELYMKIISYRENDKINKDNNKFREFIEGLYQFCRKPVDTIKHQAKTLTVGAVRQSEKITQKLNFDLPFDKFEYNNKNNNPITILKNTVEKLFSDNIKNYNFQEINRVYIHSAGLTDTISYFIINYLNNIAKKLNITTEFILLRKYDLNKYGMTEKKSKWVFLFGQDFDKSFYKKLLVKDKSFLQFHFANGKQIALLKEFQQNIISVDPSLNIVLSSLFIAINISSIFFRNNKIIHHRNNEIVNKGLDRLSRSWYYLNNSSELEHQLLNATKYLLYKRNWKCLGSGVNYICAKYTAISLIRNFNKSCAFDVLENHKHIDISAESAVIVFIANIWKKGYQADAYSEIEKMVSHENIPIIITNLDEIRYDGMEMEIDLGEGKKRIINVPVIKMPKIDEELSFPLNVLLINKILNQLERHKNNSKITINNNVPFINPSEMLFK
jgi:glucosamine 6-phosphate synthetase-like amidotransferase/phosphosugar isomerase protein